MCRVYVHGGGEGACVECMCGVYMCVGGDARVERMCVGSACGECMRGVYMCGGYMCGVYVCAHEWMYR